MVLFNRFSTMKVRATYKNLTVDKKQLLLVNTSMTLREQCQSIRKLKQQIKSIDMEIKRHIQHMDAGAKLLKKEYRVYTIEALNAQKRCRDIFYKEIYTRKELLAMYPPYVRVLSYIL